MAKKLVITLSLGFLAVVMIFVAAQAPAVGAQESQLAVPVRFFVWFEKYNPADDSITTTVGTQLDAVPYTLINWSNYSTPSSIVATVSVTNPVTHFTRDYFPWMIFVPAPATWFQTFFSFNDAKNQTNYGKCQPVGEPYNGPNVSVVLTDTVLGPQASFYNDTGIAVDISWTIQHEGQSGEDVIRYDSNVLPGQIVTGPSVWDGQMHVFPKPSNGSACWTMAWHLSRWNVPQPPTPTMTPTPTATPLPMLPRAYLPYMSKP